MPAAVIPFTAPLQAEFVVLSLAPPGAPPIPFGILLLNSGAGELHWRLREDFGALGLTAEDAEYVSYLDDDFRSRTKELGGAGFLEYLEDTLSSFVRISEREAASGRNAPQLLEKLFDRHVDARVRRFETHLPFYGLRAAATKFGEDSEISEADENVQWVRAPAGLRLTPDMFVVQVVGSSMEPLIPDGSLVVFRKVPVGSRVEKRLLIEELGTTDSSARFTVKRYNSVKRHDPDPDGEAWSEGTSEGTWSHALIRLEPLNREFPAFELDPEAFEGKYRVIGEFVQVLDPAD